MSFYLDASVIVAVTVNEMTGALLKEFLAPGRNRLIVTDFAVAESSSAIARLTRMGLRSRPAADVAFADIDVWVANFAEASLISNADVAHANLLTRRHDLNLRTPDAIHVAAAGRMNTTLITLDQGMFRAATALGLPCINPADVSAT